LNENLDFPHIGQAFLIERHVEHKKSGKITDEIVLGITSRTSIQASPQRILEINRKHWGIENRCHYVIDWNYDEDRSRIRTGHGPENITRLRRFAVGVIHFISKASTSVAEKMQQLNRNTRLVFDYLRMTNNSIKVKVP
jgi:predicted transposase YbfD/YdcC